MNALISLLLAIASVTVAWALGSVVGQLQMGHCAAKGGCVGNVLVAAQIGLIIGLIFSLPYFLAIWIFLRDKVPRIAFAKLLVPVLSGLIAGGLTLSQIRILGIPADLLVWPVIFFIVSAGVTFCFYKKG